MRASSERLVAEIGHLFGLNREGRCIRSPNRAVGEHVGVRREVAAWRAQWVALRYASYHTACEGKVPKVRCLA